jgi:GT2 family glycosyltransferase
MPLMPAAVEATPPRVCAVLVVHNGEEWLPSAIATLARVRYANLDVVAVNSASSDGSGAILAKRLPPDRIITLERNLGFGRAVAAAVTQSEAVAEADLLLLLHDDLLLHPDAVAELVAALQADESVGIVGPKLRDWGQERVLQEVGLTIDSLGRAESRLEVGELDQGQRDTQRPVLYVSTAGMLLRRDVLRRVGGFDARFPAFRDDLDLCWRAWLMGERVEVVPSAVGYHLAAASRRARPVGRGLSWEARYFAERHTLATLLKNYGALRLLWILPLVVLLGVVKVLGFLATRRLGDALATVRAYAWNVVQLPRTLRRRRHVQRRRTIGDAEVVALFAPGLPRVRSYAEAMGSWLAGGSTKALMDDADRRPLEAEERSAIRTLREHPAAAAGVLILALYILGLGGLLGAGQLVGGEVAPWPVEARDFLRAYLSPWNGEPLASESFASPAQALLGILSLLGFGSPWLAQRLIVLGLLPLAWLLALRAGRLVTTRPGPRVLGATLYVISPVLLGALAQGRLGVLVVATLLPGLLLVGIRAADTGQHAAGGWRALALLALGLAVSAALAPALLPLLGLLSLVLIGVAVIRSRGPGPGVKRLLGAHGLALLVLSPWLAELALGGWSSLVAPAPAIDLPFWRALALTPAVISDVVGIGAALVVATSAAVVLAALMLGLRVRPGAVTALLAVWAASALAAWVVAAYPWAGLWAPALLVPGVLARAGLGILAARWLADSLGAYAFGLRQVTTVVVSVVLLVGLTGGVLRIAGGPYEGLRRDPTLLPAFVAAEPARIGPYRVVLLEQSEGIVRWDVTSATGPTMLTFGTVPDADMSALIDSAIGSAVGGVDPSGGADLGLANVRYVVIAEGAASQALIASINRQPGLEPLPAGGVRVWQVRSWLPRAVVLPPDRAAALLEVGDPGDTRAIEIEGLVRSRAGRYTGPGREEGGLLALSEGAGADWRGTSTSGALEAVPVEGINAFRVEPGTEQVAVTLQGTLVHRLIVVLQLLLVLGIASLALRPPGTRSRRTAAAAELPSSLTEGADLLDSEGPIVPSAGRRAATPETAPDAPPAPEEET